jgi:hypothetical protein
MSSRCCLCKSLFNRRSYESILTFSSSYRLNSRVAIRDTMALSREGANGGSIPLGSMPHPKTMEGIHVVSIPTSFSAFALPTSDF